MSNERKRWGKRPGLFVNNSRFYILIFSVIVSLVVAFWLKLIIASDTLYAIRVQQVYGFAALIFWYCALMATPLSVIFGKQGFMQQYLYSRRALGVSAAYFALLHMVVGVYGNLGGLAHIFSLPGRFQQAVIFGFAGVLVLTLMAVTSFDKVIHWMTFPRWKWLHRMGYIASALVLLHVWIIGTHLESGGFQLAVFLPITLLFLLEAWRISGLIDASSQAPSLMLRLTIFFSLFLLASGIVALIPNMVSRYHDAHQHTELRG